jgi:hypothetical protein
MSMSRQSSLALRLAMASGVEAGDVIRELLEFELGAGPGRAVLPWAIAGGDGEAMLQIGTGPELHIERDGALTALENGQLVLADALIDWQHDLADTLSVSMEDAWRQRDAIESARPRISFSSAEMVITPQFERAQVALEEQGRVALVGPSSSGKTVIAEALCHTGWTADRLWIDFADPTVGLAGFILAACRVRPSGGHVLLVLDDLQSAPVLARSILKFMNESGLFAAGDQRIAAVTWPDGLDLIHKWFSEDVIVRADGGDACRRIVQLAEAGSHTTEHLLGLANGDALIAELGMEFYRAHKRTPTRDELAAECFRIVVGGQILSTEELESLWEMACLGIFEIDAQLNLITPVSQSALEGLLAKRVLRRKGSYVFFGHRSAARLVAYHLQQLLRSDTDRSPIRMAVGYLRRAGTSQIKQTLDRLDLVAVANEEDQFGAAFLAHCWTSAKILINHLSSLVKDDPTWGDNAASAIFAGEALAQQGLTQEWTLIANYVRSRWTLNPAARLPTYSNGIETADADDFKAIQVRMAEEDELDPDAYEMKAEAVDVDRFHRTWALGLLLGFEARAIHPDYHRIEQLRRMAAASQLPNGSFYPSRVPWVTARVCLGLAAFGEGVIGNPVLARASEWMRRRAPSGPFRFGSWRSGTGTWNTEFETTAISLLALARMGVEASNPCIRSALSYLRDRPDEWYRPGKEIDCAQAIEAALVLGDTWRDFSSPLRNLLEWAQDVRAWADVGTLASVAQDESVKAPSVASALISIIWETVKNELPLLFQGVFSDAFSGKASPLAPDLRESLLRQLRHVAQAIEQSIHERHALSARGPVPDIVAERLSELSLQDRECQLLIASLSQSSDSTSSLPVAELVTRANTLGGNVLGNAWHAIQGS